MKKPAKKKVWCLFEQSGTFKNVFKEFGYVGVKPVLSKQDYKAIEEHIYTKEELALIEIQEIKREIEQIKREIQVIERRIEEIERNLQSE